MSSAAVQRYPARVPQAAVLALEGVHKSYGSGAAQVRALRGIDLAVAPGELLALKGPSGSGKSTLLNICGLLTGPDAGRVHFDGTDATGLSMRAQTLLRREKIGFVFQSFNLVPVMTAFENVEYPLLLAGVGTSERRERVEGILGKLGLAGLGKRRPDELSGGQRQRVAIARALVKRPHLVIADEPTANLDSTTATQIIDLMHAAVAEDRASFLVATHDPAMAARCTRVLELHDGALQ
jgi:putative ABC transport system ATP-binding protein